MEAITSTAIALFAGAYDTVASYFALVPYLLATNPEVQTKIQEELDEAFERTGASGVLGYHDIERLEYLEMVMSETMRRYPIGLSTRACTEDCDIEGTLAVVIFTQNIHPLLIGQIYCNAGIPIKKGMEVHINIAGIHTDPDIFPNPEEFVPERFSKEEKAKRNP